MRPWLLITCGYPFSGKSTLAGAVSERLGMTLVAVDGQPSLLGFDLVDGAQGDREWLRAYRSAYREIARELGAGRSVVFDSVGYRRRDRDRARRLAGKHGADALVLQLRVSVEESRERLQQNAASPIRQQVPIESFERIVAEFEPPHDDELTVIYRPDIDLATWVEQVLRPVIEGQEG